jgi:hypothetical protein
MKRADRKGSKVPIARSGENDKCYIVMGTIVKGARRANRAEAGPL